MEESTKYSLNSLKLTATIMIVAFHSMSYYAKSVYWPFHGPEIEQIDVINKFLYKIAIPFFIFVSSYIFAYYSLNSSKYSTPVTFLLKKAESLLIPYFLWGGLQMIVFPSYMSWRILFWGNLQLWYLSMLFDMFFIAILIRPFWQSSGPFGDISMLLLCVLGGVLANHFVQQTLPFNIKESILYFPLFYYGMLSAKYPKILSLLSAKKKCSFIIILFSLSIIFFCSISSLPKGGNIMNIAALLAGENIALVVFIFLSKLLYNECLRNIFELFSKSCMNIYIVHHIIIWVLIVKTDFCRFAVNNVYCSILILFFVSLVGATLFAFMMAALNIKGRFNSFFGYIKKPYEKCSN